ncbi:MAG: hypothetical protein AAFO77_14145 [Pseudomonadota bacterium]
MKSSAIAAGVLALTVIAAPALARDSARFNENRDSHRPAISHQTKKIHGHKRFGILPARAIHRSLYRKGFRDVHNLRFRNGRYVARALGYRGLVRLTVNPHTGQVTSRKVIRPYRARAHRPSNGLHFHWRFN